MTRFALVSFTVFAAGGGNTSSVSTTSEAADEFSVSLERSDRDEIGRWLDESPFAGSQIIIYSADGELFMESTYQDGSVGTEELVESQSPAGRRFEKARGSSAGDHWLLGSDGKLELRDDDGVIATSNPLPRR